MTLTDDPPQPRSRRRVPLRVRRITDDRRRMPAGRAIATMLAALALASLLGADSLVKLAERQDYGRGRDALITLTKAVRSVSHALFLDRPRQWLADATDHDDPPTSSRFEADGVPTTTTVPATTTTAPTATSAPGASTTTVPTTTTTTLPARRVPTPDAPLRIYFGGDSLIGNTSEAFFRLVAGDPRITFSYDVQVSTGLVRTDVLNWADQLRADIATNDPEVVYLTFGANDDQPLIDPSGNYLALFSDEWPAEYARRVGVMMDIASEGGKRTVVWMGLPAVRPEQLNQVKDRINAAVREQAALRPDVYFADPSTIFDGPDHTYQDNVTLSDGAVVAARTSDGVHFTHEGADLLAPLLYNEIADRWHLR